MLLAFKKFKKNFINQPQKQHQILNSNVFSHSLRYICLKYRVKIKTTGFFSKKLTKVRQLTTFNYFHKYVNISMRQGLKSRYFNICMKSLCLIYTFFRKLYNKNILSTFPNFFIVKSLILANSFYFKPNNIFYVLSKSLEPIFGIKSFKKVNKKKKKKKKKLKKFKSKLLFLSKLKRKSMFLRWLYFESFYVDNKKLYKRICYSIFNSFISIKKSPLYKRKIKIYQKMIFK